MTKTIRVRSRSLAQQFARAQTQAPHPQVRYATCDGFAVALAWTCPVCPRSAGELAISLSAAPEGASPALLSRHRAHGVGVVGSVCYVDAWMGAWMDYVDKAVSV